MNSPLFVLAERAESELNSRRISLDSADEHATLAHVFQQLPSPPSLSSDQLVHSTHSGDEGRYWVLSDAALVSSPGGVNLRVDATERNANGKRLDPFAIELIESVLSKGTDILSQPVFPYTCESEPLRLMQIRVHLRHRYESLPRDADVATRVQVTERLLRLWGAKLVKTCDSSTFSTTSTTTGCTAETPSESPIQPLRLLHHPSDTFCMVSPLKRGTKTTFISKKGGEDCKKSASMLSLKENNVLVQEHGKGTPPPIVPVGTTSVAATLKSVATFQKLVPEQHCKKQKLLSCKKKQTATKGQSVRRIVRRWTQESRQLFIKGLETHGLGAHEQIKRMIPGK